MEAPRRRGTPHQMRLLENFKTVDPPIFDGIGYPDQVEGWLSRMNRPFTCGGYEFEQRMALIPSFLKGKASLWLDDVMEMLRESYGTRPEHKKKLPKWSDFEKKILT